MPLDFPSNPVNGQTYDNFYWDASTGVWRNNGSKNALSSRLTSLETAAPRTVASAAARNAMFPSPVPGNSVYRSDLAYEERYYDGEGWKPVKGQILQIVSFSTQQAVTSSSSTMIPTGISATITPKHTSSKIIVQLVQSFGKSAQHAENSIQCELRRDSTVIAFPTNLGGYSPSAGGFALFGIAGNATLVDAPNTTSSVTYSTYFRNYVNGNVVYINAYGDTSSITLIEVAA